MVDALPAVVPDPDARFAPFPLTDQQHAYLVGRTGEVELGNVSTHAYYEYEGDLDVDRFALAWRRVVERHDVLRVVLRPERGDQVVLADAPPFAVEVLDLRGLPADVVAAKLAEVRDRLSHEVRPPDVYPLYSVVVSRLTDARARVHVSFDGISLDYLSWQLLVADLTRFYSDPDHAPEPLELTFRDYVLAQESTKDSPAYRRAEAYWTEQAADLPPSPALPIATDPAAITHPRWTSRFGTLDPERWTALKTAAARAGLTPTALVLAAFAEVMAVWSDSPRFTVNVPRMNRLPLHPQANEILGEFASFSLLAVEHDGTAPFAQRAKAVQRRLWTDLAHQQVTGVRVLRELMKARGGFTGVAMPVVLTSTLGFDAGDAPLLGSVLPRVFALSQTPQVYLDVQIEQSPTGELVYNFDSVDAVFPDGLVADLIDAFGAVLDRLATDGTAWTATDLVPVRAPSTLTGPTEPVPDLLVQDLFLEQVAIRPDAPAVITSTTTLTYADLARRARQVAHWLREHGATPGKPVAVVTTKGWEQAVAAYGALFAGTPYVPIDADLPPARVAALLAQSGARLVLTQSRHDVAHGRAFLHLDTELDGLPDTPLDPDQTPDDLAYVLFTSGSTGTPKGAMVEHRGMVNCLRDTIGTFGVGPDDRAIAVTALHHDMSTFDLFGVLGAGGAIVVPDADRARDADHWAELVAVHGVTIWNSVPAMVEMLLDAGAAPTGLRLVLLGGDWIPLRVPTTLMSLVDGVRVVSVGGPTETTLWNIWHPIDVVDPAWRSVPYGAPIANTRYRVLDPWLRERPVGVVGELCCAGPGVARGYLDDPERTAAAFVERDGERLYRTGDLGRVRPDGLIEFVGRADTQVKLRGQRVETGEVEAALAALDGVRGAVVTPVPAEGGRGHRGLAAHVTGDALDPEALRRGLAERLPAHMVPATITAHAAFPLTRNGKVDRAALAALRAEQVAAPTPMTPLEEVIAEVWADVLEVDRVGPDDDFFAIGGDSVMATRIVAVLREVLDSPEIGLLSVLSTVTVRQLAAALSAAQPGRLEQVAELYLEITRMSEDDVAAALGSP